MFKIIILIAFVLVLLADFVHELGRKNFSFPSICIRAFMIIAFSYLCDWF